MARRPYFLVLFVALVGLVLSGAVLAQLETGDRGILPLDSSGTLEITGIHVDVGGKDAQSARFAGWRIAQREGFKALWAKTNGRPLSEAPNLPDSTLDGLVSSIIVEREQLGPTRYIADLGILFDRARAGALLGVGGGEVRRSVPMLLIPITVTGGTATTVELRNAWQRAWAEFRTNQSPLDYVRISGMGIDPVLVNAAQTRRPGRGWWRNIVDFYGAADILTAEVLVHRLYPGGPAQARFIARHGPDNQIVGGFDLRAADSAGIPAMMREGVQRMDALFAEALAAGRLRRDPTLDIPEPPPLPEELVDAPQTTEPQAYLYQVQIAASNVNTYNFAMAHLRTLAGIKQVTPVAINPAGTSYVTVSYQGSGGALAAALAARGWTTDSAGTIVRMAGGAGAPPPLPPPPPPPQATPPPASPAPEPQANASGE
ncbi:heavy-metal-associated domain-containing protein [Sphingomonas sp.]|uniref:heavy-metal-associated domain-containing protein n=1 Tax=Sphingomonas sp. TaxID=28214 RepID=UPI00286DB211|nr:heavy-metal-associated domain-containing protein [Sphingomonas sp.]